MAMSKPDTQKVEVDMVPLIDVITLLLMFLVMVGDLAASANTIQMKLPRASEAKTAKEIKLNTKGLMVVQMKKQSDGRYQAVINNKSYDLMSGGLSESLLVHLQNQVQFMVDRKDAIRNSDQSVNSPVKLRIPEECPMFDVEKVLMALSRVGLTNVHYAADPFRRH